MNEYYLGQFIKSYNSNYLSIHKILNNLFGDKPYTFPQTAILQQTKKFPDVSFYQGEINWDTMRTQTDAVIIRAGQNLWPDTQFARNWKEAKRVGMARGVYWFYDDRIDPGKQADILISQIINDPPEMEVYADWETSFGGSFGSLSNVVAFMQKIEAAIPHVKVAMYTGYYWFRDHSNAVTNYTQYNYLKSKPLWLAWYTSNDSIVVIPQPWSSLIVWQYGTPSEGEKFGVKSIEIDMNYFNGTQTDFNSRYNVTSGDIITYPFEGVQQVSGSRNGYRFWMHIIDPSKVRYEISEPSVLSRVSTIAKSYGASLAWNGSDYDRITHELHVGYPAFSVVNGKFVDIVNSGQGIYGIRPLIQNGVISSRLYETDATATEGHSRTCFGKTVDGKTMHFVSEGIYPNQGLRLRDVAEIMKEYSCLIAADAGGGGDTTLVIDSTLVNVPEDIDGGVHVERRLPQILLAYAGNGEQMGDYVKLTSNVAGEYRSVREQTNYPTVPHIFGVTLVKLSSGNVAEAAASDFYVYQSDVVVNGITQAKAGDKWWKVYKVNGVPAVGWIAEIHRGVRYLNVEFVAQTPSTQPTLKHTIEVYSDGSIKVDGNLIP